MIAPTDPLGRPIVPAALTNPAALADVVEQSKARYPDGFNEAVVLSRAERENAPAIIPTAETKKEPGICYGCAQPFQASVCYVGGKEILRGRYCEPCVEAEHAKQADESKPARKSKADQWAEICPADYRNTDMLKLRRDMAEKVMTLQTATPRVITVDDVLRYDRNSDRGLAFIGRSAQRKTRIMFAFLQKCHEAGQGVVYINAVHFADQLAAQYDKGSHAAEAWMMRLERAPRLFIDDLGKEKLTERVEAAYYRIVEARKSRGLSLDFTCNSKASGLIEKWERNAQAQGFFSGRAEPIVRRLREMTVSITINDR